MPGLRRELGRWDLTAIGVNQVIGGALFAQPSLYAASVGGWSPWLVAAVGLASLLVALSFAEVSSRFDATGGPYLYTRSAFGRFAAFEVGWMLWFTRTASWAAVINVLATALAFYLPSLAGGWARAGFIAVIIVMIAAINIRGIRQSSLVLNVLTIGKLLPLLAFIAVGIFYLDPALLVPQRTPLLAELSATGLLLIFAFGGYEVIPVPAGEARDPKRAVPFALIMTIVIVTVVMTLVQVVALGTLPGLAGSRTPLADAATLFMGGMGAALLTLGAVLSTTGNNMGAGSLRLAQPVRARRAGRSPPILRSGAPAVSHAGECDPRHLGRVARPGRIRTLLGPCACQRHQPPARLRRDLRLDDSTALGRVRRAGSTPATFVVPFGPLIPGAAIVLALSMIAGARREQLIAGVIALIVGSFLYLIAVRRGLPAMEN